MDQGAAPHCFSTAEDYYRSFYFEALDLVSELILTRFSQESMSIPNELLTAANQQDNAPVVVTDNICTMYSNDVNFERAVVQLQMLPDVVKTYKESQGLRRLDVTNLRTLANVMNGVPMAKRMFSDADKLLHLYFTIPVTTCTAEKELLLS